MYLGCFEGLVRTDRLSLLVDLVRHALRSGSTILDVVLDTKVVIRSTGVVASSEKDTAVGLVLADDVRARGGREKTVLTNDEGLNTVGGADAKDRLNRLGHEEAAVTTDEERLGDGRDRVEDRLDEVLGVVLYASSSVQCLVIVDHVAYLLLEDLDTIGRAIPRSVPSSRQ
jgi:hypothetical protein